MSKLNSAITKAFVSAAMLALPAFLETANETMGIAKDTAINTATNVGAHAATIGDVAANMHGAMAGMTNLLSMMAYIMGIMFALMAAIDFKAYNENPYGDRSYDSKEEEKPIEIKAEEVKPVVLEKKEEPKPVVIRKQEEKIVKIDFDSYELNALLKEIQEKVEELKDNTLVKNDMESMLMVEKTEGQYLRKIFQNYIDVPKKKRGIKGVQNSTYDLTFNQLTLLLKGLDEVENKIVKNSVMNQRANEIFLKEKVANL